MNIVDEAVYHFAEGYNCGQSVFSAAAPQFGLEAATAQRIATSLGGGMGRMGEMCGALSGACLALGLKFGTSDPDDKAAKDCNYAHIRDLLNRFKNLHGSYLCRELVGYDVCDPQQHQLARESGVFTERCPKFVEDAARLLAEALDDLPLKDETG